MATRAIPKTRRRPLGAVRRLGRPFPFACLDDSLTVAIVSVAIGVLNPIVDVTLVARSLEQRMSTGYAAFLWRAWSERSVSASPGAFRQKTTRRDPRKDRRALAGQEEQRPDRRATTRGRKTGGGFATFRLTGWRWTLHAGAALQNETALHGDLALAASADEAQIVA